MTIVNGRQSARANNFAFPVLVIFLFTVFSGAFDIAALVPLHPIFFLATIGLISIIASGRFVTVVKSSVGRMLVLFTLWFIVCIPFAIWRGGSFAVLMNSWYKSALIFILTAGLLITVRNMRTIFFTVGYSVGILALQCLVRNQNVEGRLVLANTRFGNPNDLGWACLVGLPFLAYIFAKGGWIHKFASGTLTVATLLALVKTGSRASMIGAGVLCLIVFFQSTAATKMKLALGFPLLLVIAMVAAPNTLVGRYFTFFEANKKQVSEDQLSAVASAEGRLQLLKDSLVLTLEHPVFGVGPGNFEDAQADLAKDRGERASWHETHNTYTQISSEMGIVGFLLYATFLVRALKILFRSSKVRYKGKAWDEMRTMARTLLASLITLAVVAAFGSFAYDNNIPILAGMATALGFMVRKQLAADRAVRERDVESSSPTGPLIEPVLVGRF